MRTLLILQNQFKFYSFSEICQYMYVKNAKNGEKKVKSAYSLRSTIIDRFSARTPCDLCGLSIEEKLGSLAHLAQRKMIHAQIRVGQISFF